MAATLTMSTHEMQKPRTRRKLVDPARLLSPLPPLPGAQRKSTATDTQTVRSTSREMGIRDLFTPRTPRTPRFHEPERRSRSCEAETPRDRVATHASEEGLDETYGVDLSSLCPPPETEHPASASTRSRRPPHPPKTRSSGHLPSTETYRTSPPAGYLPPAHTSPLSTPARPTPPSQLIWLENEQMWLRATPTGTSTPSPPVEPALVSPTSVRQRSAAYPTAPPAPPRLQAAPPGRNVQSKGSPSIIEGLPSLAPPLMDPAPKTSTGAGFAPGSLRVGVPAQRPHSVGHSPEDGLAFVSLGPSPASARYAPMSTSTTSASSGTSRTPNSGFTHSPHHSASSGSGPDDIVSPVEDGWPTSRFSSLFDSLPQKSPASPKSTSPTSTRQAPRSATRGRSPSFPPRSFYAPSIASPRSTTTAAASQRTRQSPPISPASLRSTLVSPPLPTVSASERQSTASTVSPTRDSGSSGSGSARPTSSLAPVASSPLCPSVIVTDEHDVEMELELERESRNGTPRARSGDDELALTLTAHPDGDDHLALTGDEDEGVEGGSSQEVPPGYLESQWEEAKRRGTNDSAFWRNVTGVRI